MSYCNTGINLRLQPQKHGHSRLYGIFSWQYYFRSKYPKYQLITNSSKSDMTQSTTVSVLEKTDKSQISDDEIETQNEKFLDDQLGVSGWGVLVGLCWAATTIVSVDRTAMSIAIIPMSQELAWDEATKGLVNSSFLLAYMISNLVAGPLGVKFAPSRVLCGGLILWSCATALTPMAAHQSFNTLLLARVFLGLGEGVAFPSIMALFRERVPQTKRTRITGLTYSGINFGTVISLTTAPVLINYFGWPGVFETYGSLAFIWAPLWLTLVPAVVPQNISNDSTINNPQTLDMKSKIKQVEEQEPSSWRELLGSSAVWAIIISQGSWACGFYTTMAWLPTYFNQEFNVDIKSSALLTLLPVILKFCSTNLSGWIFDALVNRQIISRTLGRKIFSGISTIGPGSLFLILAITTSQNSNLNLQTALILICLSQFPKGFCAAGFGSNHADLGVKSVGTIFGIASAFASLAGSAAVYLTGVALDNYGSWSVVFEGLAVTYFIGAVVYTKYGSAEQQFN